MKEQKPDLHCGRQEPAEFAGLRGATIEDVDWIFNSWSGEDEIRHLVVRLPDGEKVLVWSAAPIQIEEPEPEEVQKPQTFAPPTAANQDEE